MYAFDIHFVQLYIEARLYVCVTFTSIYSFLRVAVTVLTHVRFFFVMLVLQILRAAA